MGFEALGLSSEILRVLEELGFERPSKIQAESIPTLLKGGTDFIGLAQTGTGKTAAFGLPLLERVDPKLGATQGLILAPTRELGRQIAEQLEIFSKYQSRVSMLAVYGGAAIINQIKALRRPQHVIIATPGRLIDLIKRRSVDLSQLKYLVLDEADEMLNMGFKDELDEILRYTPESKETWLFSATMPNEIKKIVDTYMDHPVEVRINAKDKVNTNIEHLFAVIKQSDKYEALTRFIDVDPDMRSVVFCRTKRGTQSLAESLMRNNYKADAIHGDLSQNQRDRVMSRFKAHDLKLLIATDVAARGIDVNDLTHVFHYSLPDDNSYYTHRSGRTARAGKKGKSIAFINSREGYRINKIERQLGINFKKAEIPAAEDIATLRIQKWCEDIHKEKTQGLVEPKFIALAQESFEEMSKDELIAKLLVRELAKLNTGSTKNLNDNNTRSSSSRERNSRDDRGGRGRGRRTGSRGGSSSRGGSGGGSGGDNRGFRQRQKDKKVKKKRTSTRSFSSKKRPSSEGRSWSKK